MCFGELLKMKKQKLKMQLIEDLLLRFDASSSELFVHGNVLTVSIDDVVTTIGVQAEGNDVETELGDADEVRVRYNLGKGNIKCYNLHKDMVSLTGDEEFKGKFLLYVISQLLRPSTSLHVPNSYLKLLTNIEGVKNLNWAKFVYEGILEGVRGYHAKDGVSHIKKYVTGCILVLEISYLEHVKIFNDIPRRQINSLLRIQYWDENSITKITRKVYDLGGLDSIQVIPKIYFHN
ncbi:hypothetical protein LINPERPRIM_LOCUS33154 [Linum perenne]